MNAKDKKWLLVVLILSGLVLGGLLGELTAGNPSWSWLSYGDKFGIMEPLVIDLRVIRVSFAFSININVASIIGMLTGIFIYSKTK